MELTTEFSKLRLESATIDYDGDIHIVFLEYIDTLDGKIFGIKQHEFHVEYNDETPFESALLRPYRDAARVLWQLRDGLVSRHV